MNKKELDALQMDALQVDAIIEDLNIKMNDTPLTATELKYYHEYLVNKMTPQEQNVVDCLLFETGTELVDTCFPLSNANRTGKMLDNNDYFNERIQNAKWKVESSKKYHPIFDYKFAHFYEPNAFCNFKMESFDPYMEFTYLSLIDETMQELGKACETAGIENWYKLDKDTFKRIEQKINDVNEMGRLKFSDKLFVNYRMSNIFRYTYGAPLLPSYIEGSIFVDTRFEYLNLKDIEFVNCIFIDCIFDCCDMSGCQFKTCEFLNTEMSVMENSNGYKTSFAGCYMRRRIENGRQTDEIGEHVFQPWDDPLSITMRSNNNGTVQSCLLFSGCVGVPTKASFLNTLERDSKGFLCYKRIGGTSYPRPDRWVIENGSFLTENVNSEVLELCERGVNVANWFFAFTQYTDSDLWLCRIRYEDIGDVCVPWSSNGKFRATRVELLHQIRNWKTQLTLTIKEVEKYNRMKIIPALQDEVEGRYNIIHEDYILEVDKSKYQQYLPTWWWDK